jgi:hypothetical protein
MKRGFAVVFGLGLVFSAFALSTYVSVFNENYKVGKDSTLGKAKCLVCHLGPKGGKLNPYGKDVEAAAKKAGGKKVTAPVLKAVEGLKNKAGVKYIDQIKKDKLPAG